MLPTLTEEQSLRTTEAQLGACERVYLAADLKGDLAIQLKAVAEARAILKAAELEKSNAELVALLLELKPALRTHPALKGHLRSV